MITEIIDKVVKSISKKINNLAIIDIIKMLI